MFLKLQSDWFLRVFCLLNFCFSCLTPRFSPALATKTDVLTCFTTFLLGAPSARVRSLSLRVKGKLALLVGQADRSTLRVCASSATLTEPSARVRFRPLFPNKKAPERGLFIWSGWRESNPRIQLGKLLLCHWATPAKSVLSRNHVVERRSRQILIQSSR